jgi:hypothetical protein
MVKLSVSELYQIGAANCHSLRVCVRHEDGRVGKVDVELDDVSFSADAEIILRVAALIDDLRAKDSDYFDTLVCPDHGIQRRNRHHRCSGCHPDTPAPASTGVGVGVIELAVES